MAQGQVFSCECCEFFKNRFFYRTSLVVAFAKERGKKFQMKEENENISFKFYLQLCKCYNCSPFFSYFFFKFSFFSFLHDHFLCFHFLQTEKYLKTYHLCNCLVFSNGCRVVYLVNLANLKSWLQYSITLKFSVMQLE